MLQAWAQRDVAKIPITSISTTSLPRETMCTFCVRNFAGSMRKWKKIPLPTGEGAAKQRVRSTTRKIISFGTPHPALRATFSRREKDASMNFLPHPPT
jgi:hypothetical protein